MVCARDLIVLGHLVDVVVGQQLCFVVGECIEKLVDGTVGGIGYQGVVGCQGSRATAAAALTMSGRK